MFQWKMIHHNKNQESFNLKKKRIDNCTKITEMLELSDENFKPPIIKMFNEQLIQTNKKIESLL